MILDGETIGVIGAILTPFMTVIGVLWTRNIKLQSDYDNYRTDTQKMLLDLQGKQIEFTSNSNKILETAQKTIDVLVQSVNTLKDELIRGKIN